MHHMVHEFGRPDRLERTSFRHTIYRGRPSMDFYVANESSRITVWHSDVSDIAWPYWCHDALINALASKLRHLTAVQGSTLSRGGGNPVSGSVRLYRGPRVTGFVDLTANGMIAIDFDARTNNGHGIHNHGTKFKNALSDLQ